MRECVRRIVREGYERLAPAYLHLREGDTAERPLVDALLAAAGPGARVLDAGCGAGVPVGRWLAATARVTGADVAQAQLRLARELVPRMRLARGDLVALPFRDGAFDAAICLYALIHVPREEHALALAELARVLRPGGWLLCSLGRAAVEGDVEEDWLGAGVAMAWSHWDLATSRALLAAAGFTIQRETLVTEGEGFGGGRHPLVLAVKEE